jgi:hypothetical protein
MSGIPKVSPRSSPLSIVQTSTQPSPTFPGGPRAIPPVRPQEFEGKSRFEEPPAKPKGLSLGNSTTNLLRVLDNKPAPNDPADDAVAVFDDFTIGPVPHGNSVQSVIERSGSTPSSEIRQVAALKPGLAEYEKSGIDGMVEQRVSKLLNDTSTAIESVLENPGRIGVINQSGGVTKAGLVNTIWNEARMAQFQKDPNAAFLDDPPPPPQLVKDLKLPANASKRDVYQALVNKVDEAVAKSEDIQKAQQRYLGLSKKLEDKGITHVLATGNDGKFASDLEAMGVKPPKDFTRSVLTTGTTLNVGASTGDTPDAIAPFSNGGDHVNVVMDGTDIDTGAGGKLDGTSFSAPQVTAVIAEMRRIDPSLTNDQIRDILNRASKDTAIPNNLEGSGVLDANEALRLTREHLKQQIPKPELRG